MLTEKEIREWYDLEDLSVEKKSFFDYYIEFLSQFIELFAQYSGRSK